MLVGSNRVLVIFDVMPSIEQLTQELLALPSESRALLADRLVESLEFDIDPEIEAAWLDEARKRRHEIQNGSVEAIPGEDALARVRKLLE